MTRFICMWSGPRNLSTAMMRSFGARPDCDVWDEPFFAPFLHITGKAHPGRAETLERHETDPQKIARACLAPGPNKAPFFFQKHMPHHMISGFPRDWMRDERISHFFLIRDPARVIASYAKGRAEFTYDDLGFGPQNKLFHDFSQHLGHPPPVINSHDILTHPKAALATLCTALHMPFDLSMLSWEKGPHLEDGAWAPYWYGSVWNSTGFHPPSKDISPSKNTSTDAPKLHTQENYHDLLARCEEDYAPLKAAQITIAPNN